MKLQNLSAQCRMAGVLFIAGAAIMMQSSAGSFTWKRYAAPDHIQQVACDTENCWVVTNAGLTRISLTGGKITQYTSDNSGLSFMYTPRIAVDRNFDTWVISQKLYRIKNGQLEDMSGVYSRAPYDQLWNIFTDPQGSLWGMNGDTLFHLHDSIMEGWHFEWPAVSQKFSVDTLGCLYICGGRDGLYKNDHGQTTIYTPKNSGLPVDKYGTAYFLTAIAVDANNVKWIGTDGGGLIRYDGTWQLVWTPLNYIESIYADPNNLLWIMGQGRLACFDGIQWQERNTILSTVPGNGLWLQAVDRSGRMYFSTAGGRLYCWEQWSSREIAIATVPLAGNHLSGLAMDRHDVLWMVSGNPATTYNRYANICSFDGRNWASYDSSACPLYNNFSGIVAVDRNDTKWFADYALCSFDGTTWRCYDSSAVGFKLGGVTSLAFDSRNRPWIGTGNGLAFFDGSKWKLYDTANSALPYPWVTSLTIDRNDTRWLIARTPSGGWCELSCPPVYVDLCTMDSAGFHVQNPLPFSVGSSSILACDSSGRICFSIDSGIVRFDKGQWNPIKSGAIRYVQSMTVDARGILWLTAYSGVFCLGPDGWTKISLPDSQFSGSYRQVACNSRGDMFYSGNELGLFVGTSDQNIALKGKPPAGPHFHVPQSGFINPVGPMRIGGRADRASTVAIFDLRGRLIGTRLIPSGKSIDIKAVREKLRASTGIYIYKEN